MNTIFFISIGIIVLSIILYLSIMLYRRLKRNKLIKHYEELRDNLSNINVNQEILFIKSIIPIIAILGIINTILNILNIVNTTKSITKEKISKNIECRKVKP